MGSNKVLNLLLFLIMIFLLIITIIVSINFVNEKLMPSLSVEDTYLSKNGAVIWLDTSGTCVLTLDKEYFGTWERDGRKIKIKLEADPGKSIYDFDGNLISSENNKTSNIDALFIDDGILINSTFYERLK